MVMKFNPQGLVTMVLGRKDEAIDYLEKIPRGGRSHRCGREREAGRRRGRGGSFGRPTDVAFDTRAISSSPTATTTLAWRSSRRTASS